MADSAKPKPKETDGARVAAIIVTIAIFVAVWWYWPRDKSPTATDSTLADISDRLGNPVDDGAFTTIPLTTRGLDAGSLDVYEAGTLMVSAAQWRLTHGDSFSSLGFEVFVPTTDRYGNSHKVPGWTITFDAADLRQVHWNGYNGWQMLNLGTPTDITYTGRQLISKFCEASEQQALHFCLAAAVN